MRDDALRLSDMLEAIERIRRFTLEGEAAFYSDRNAQDAVASELLILGEAASRVGEPLRRAKPRVPWKRLVGLRNELAHEYFRISPADEWAFVAKELEPLERALRSSRAVGSTCKRDLR